MFFIPIAAIVIFIWLIVYAVQQGRMASLNADINRSIAKSQRLQDAVLDWDASYLAEQKLRSPQQRRKAVADFMGGGPDWELYSCNLDEGSLLTLSINALLVKQGHLSFGLASSGTGTWFYGRSPAISAVKWRTMTEQYLLALSDELERHGIHAEVICRKSYPGAKNPVPDTNLRRYIAEHGPGQTEGFSYRFTSAS